MTDTAEPTDAKPVAWLVPKLHTFKGAERVRFTRAPGCTMTDAELTDYMEGRVMWLPTTFCDSDAGVTDKFGVVHKPKPLYTTPQPTQAQPGAVPLTDGQAKEVLWAEHLRWMQAVGLDTEGMCPGEWLDHWLTYVRAIERAHGIKGGQP